MRLSQTVVKCEPVNGYESGVVVTINETDTMYIGRAYTTYNGFTEEDVLKQVNDGGMKCFLLPIAPASMNSEMSQIVYGNAPLLSWMKPLEVVSREISDGTVYVSFPIDNVGDLYGKCGGLVAIICKNAYYTDEEEIVTLLVPTGAFECASEWINEQIPVELSWFGVDDTHDPETGAILITVENCDVDMDDLRAEVCKRLGYEEVTDAVVVNHIVNPETGEEVANGYLIYTPSGADKELPTLCQWRDVFNDIRNKVTLV